MAGLKAELGALLETTVLPRSLSKKYPTREENHQLLEGYKGRYYIQWTKTLGDVFPIFFRHSKEGSCLKGCSKECTVSSFEKKV